MFFPVIVLLTMFFFSVTESVKEKLDREETERVKVENERQLALHTAVMTTHNSVTQTVRKMKESCKVLTRINPEVMLQYCELRAWLPVLSDQISSVFEQLIDEKNAPPRPVEGL